MIYMGMKNWRQFNESSKDKFSADLVLGKIIELSNEINDLLRLRFDDEGYDYEFYEIVIWDRGDGLGLEDDPTCWRGEIDLEDGIISNFLDDWQYDLDGGSYLSLLINFEDWDGKHPVVRGKKPKIVESFEKEVKSRIPSINFKWLDKYNPSEPTIKIRDLVCHT